MNSGNINLGTTPPPKKKKISSLTNGKLIGRVHSLWVKQKTKTKYNIRGDS